jgi:N-acetyl-anhydromuramyl-L-alanine amidase AmpD
VPGRSNVVKPAVRELRGRVAGFVNDPADLFNPPKADRTWRYIVLHHSAHETGSYAQIDREHRERLGTQGCGYHFVIGNGSGSPDGQVEVATRWSDQMGGAHCRDAKSPEMNEYGIGICLIGDLEKKPPTARQVEATRTLISYLQARYDIPAEDIGTHRDFSGTKTACPGDHFPMAILETRESVAKFSSLRAK